MTVGENSDTSKEARYLKTDTEPPGDMHTPLTTAGTRHVLLDSLEDALETPRRRCTSREDGVFKVGTKLSGHMYAAFLT